MATFSLWKDFESVKQFAYSKQHKEAIKKTREYEWYSEELFSRFQPYKSSGTWEGKTFGDLKHVIVELRLLS
jgi:heme-degrading monooxygenase HmoA